MKAHPTSARPAATEAQGSPSTTPRDSPLPQPILTTSRLIIRALHPQDRDSMSLNANNSLLTKYMSNSFPDPYTLSAADEWIAMNTAKSLQENFGICEIASPEVMIGGIGIKPGADVSSHTAEVGFWIGQRYWGKGYTTEALEGLTRWMFLNNEAARKKTTRLYGHVFGGNVAKYEVF